MTCQRCGYDFCWTCMGQINECRKWYKLCPSLGFSMKINILITVLFILFLPLVITLGPFFYIIWFCAISLPEATDLHGSRNCVENCICYSLSILLVIPIALAVGMPIVAICDVFLIIPLYILSFSFLVRILITMCKAKV